MSVTGDGSVDIADGGTFTVNMNGGPPNFLIETNLPNPFAGVFARGEAKLRNEGATVNFSDQFENNGKLVVDATSFDPA